jgi:mannose-1-phosphate guanylyltransferase
MRAVLLAAGLGTRLRPLTDHTPKCLVEIAGRPLLDYWLRDLHAVGITEFLVNTHYLADKVRGFVRNHELSSKVTLVHEEQLLGTAGTLLANRSFLAEGTTLVAHADNLCLCHWPDFFDGHQTRPPGTAMTMMTFQTKMPSECGIVELDDRGVVAAFHEKIADPPGNLANAAVYLIEHEVLRFIDSLGPNIHDLSTQVLHALVGRMFTWQNHGLLIDIGTPERLKKAVSSVRRLSGKNN